MEVLSIAEAAEQLGVKHLATSFVLQGLRDIKSATFYLPTTATDQTIFARSISKNIAMIGVSFLQITHWTDDADSNQDLFYGYRKAFGDERSLSEASIHKFDINENLPLGSVLSLVMYFGWDARIFDAGLTYEMRVNNDGFIDYDTTSIFQHEFMDTLSFLESSESAK